MSIQLHELEQELNQVECDLEIAYEIDSALKPYVDDAVRGEIYYLQTLRDQLKRAISSIKNEGDAHHEQ